MSLTAGTGPFGPHPNGRLNFEPPDRVVYVEPWPRRVRAVVGDSVVVDSERTDVEPEVEGYVRVPWSRADR